MPGSSEAKIDVRSRVVDLYRVGLIITGDDHSEVVTARNDGDVYAVGGRPGLTALPDCSIVSPGRAECPADGRAEIWTAGGDDDVRLGRGIRASYFSGAKGSDHLVGADMRDLVDGRQGADDVSGRGAKDHVSGFTGNDRVSGGSGDDLVSAGTGFDRLFGGSGSDTLNAFDEHRDKRIDCGGGTDVAYVDPHLDPRPQNCEQVRHRPMPSQDRKATGGP